MSVFRDPGTPLGGERTVKRRIFSPESNGASASDNTMEPQTPEVLRNQEFDIVNALSSLLDEKLKPLSEGNVQLRTEMQQCVQTTQAKIDDIRNELQGNTDTLDVRLASVEKSIDFLQTQAGTEHNTEGATIAQLQQQIQALQQAHVGTVQGLTDMTITAVIGGFKQIESFGEAKKMLADKLGDLYLEAPHDIYCKGDFTGLLFAKFGKQAQRDSAVAKFQSEQWRVHGEQIWAKPETPLEVRAMNGSLFAAKRMLVTWGWPKWALWVDPNTGTMTCGDDKVMHVSVSGSKLEITYQPGWKEEIECPEWTQVVQHQEMRLAKGG